MIKLYSVIVLLLLFTISLGQTPYFPPLLGSNWETTSLQTLKWDETKVPDLYNYLENANTKAFIVLKDGKIVLEKYFGTFTRDSSWYWASAGKSLTAFLIGKAQEEGFLSVNDTTSKFLGEGWTSCPAAKEDKITILNQITMTTGLDDGVSDNHCTQPQCLTYLADPGTRWAYHNAPYTLLEKVIESATKQSINIYTYSKVKQKTGITGLWAMVDADNVFFSTPRSMARYGILIQNRGIWGTDTLLHDTNYFDKMVSTSQQLNKSYGYLWWLNGKASYMLPTVQYVFNGSYAPDAPADMFAALGKNGQVLSISPSKGIVVVRMGDKPDEVGGELPMSLTTRIWSLLNALMKDPTSNNQMQNNQALQVYPNPCIDELHLRNYDGKPFEIFDSFGKRIIQNNGISAQGTIDVSVLKQGLYLLKTQNQSIAFLKK